MIERDIFGLKNDVKSEFGVFWSAQYQYSHRRIDTIPPHLGLNASTGISMRVNGANLWIK
jgi:hypothetical protein